MSSGGALTVTEAIVRAFAPGRQLFEARGKRGAFSVLVKESSGSRGLDANAGRLYLSKALVCTRLIGFRQRIPGKK